MNPEKTEEPEGTDEKEAFNTRIRPGLRQEFEMARAQRNIRSIEKAFEQAIRLWVDADPVAASKTASQGVVDLPVEDSGKTPIPIWSILDHTAQQEFRETVRLVEAIYRRGGPDAGKAAKKSLLLVLDMIQYHLVPKEATESANAAPSPKQKSDEKRKGDPKPDRNKHPRTGRGS